MNLIKYLVGKQKPSGRCLFCTVCGKRVKGSYYENSSIYMGPNGVVVQDFAAGKRGLCHNECVGKNRVTLQAFHCITPVTTVECVG